MKFTKMLALRSYSGRTNYELNALGRNLNQIARVLNADGTRTDLMTLQMIQALQSSISGTQQTIRALVRAGNNIWSVDDV